MEFHQANRVVQEKQLLMSVKWYAFSLALPKFVYARDKDSENNTTLREFYPNVKKRSRVLGAKNVQNIKTIFTCKKKGKRFSFFNSLQMSSLKDYHYIYLICDVLLLADVFEKFPKHL